MARFEEYSQLLSETIRRVTEQEEFYREFLRTSAWNFKYSLPDRLLIFAQKPEAIACAKVSLWEDKRFNRVVKSDSLGIAVLNGQELQILYDVSDTLPLDKENKPFAVWEFDHSFSDRLIEELKQFEPAGSVSGEGLEDFLEELIMYKLDNIDASYYDDLCEAENISEEIKENFLLEMKSYVLASISFIVQERMGLSRSEELKFDQLKNAITTEEGFRMILAIEQRVSEDLLREIAYLIQRSHPAPVIEKIKREDYYDGHNKLQQRGSIFRAGIEDGGEDGVRQIRPDETGLSEEQPAGQVHVLPDAGDTEQASDGSGSESEGTGERDDEGASEEISESQIAGSSAADQLHEQPETDSGGTDLSETDLHLDEEKESPDEPLPVVYTDSKGKSRIREDLLLDEIRRGSGFAEGKFRINEFFAAEHSAKEKSDFLKDEYGIGGHTSFVDELSFVDHDSKGLSFLVKYGEKPVVYSWADVAAIISSEVEKGTYLTDSERLYIPIYENKKQIRSFDRKLTEHFKKHFPDKHYEIIRNVFPYLSNDSYPYSDFVNQLQSFAGKELLVSCLSEFKSGIWEEQQERESLIKELNSLWSLEDVHDPGWTSLDWELLRDEERNVLSDLFLAADDHVFMQGKEFVVLEKDGNDYVLEDIEFPLLTETCSYETLNEVLKEDSRNDDFFHEKGTGESGRSLSHRNYRLLEYISKEFMQHGTDTVSFADSNSLTTVFLHLENEEKIRLSIFNGEREQEAISLLITLDKANRVLIPAEYRSEFDDNDFLNKISEESKQKQLTGFIYTVFSGVVNNGFVLTSEKEVFHENNEHEEQEHDEAIEEVSAASQQQNRIDYRIREMSELPEGGPKTKYAWNIEAIRTLKQIEEEQRLATAEEQKILARYVGWGGLANAFDSHNQSWANEYEELKELLTEDEYASARESTLTAFYTPPDVISGIYMALNNLGFTKGNILEPACGTGNFFGMLPETMEGSNLYGIELDSLSGRIAKQLYQNSNIAIEGFEKTRLPDQFFDVAIGNVPFGQFGVIDDAYKNENFMIHDYFFAKALSKVHPGGIIAFITSKGTMDKKDPKVREYIAKRADLLGAIRLPNNVFSGNAGTTVTSDILILQKRDRQRLDMPSWTKTGVNEDGFELNNYFIEHPDMVLGRLSMETGQGGRLDLACLPNEGNSFDESLMDAVSKINGHYEAISYELEDMVEDLPEAVPADISIQNFGYTLIDDVVYQRRDSMMYPVETNATALNRIRALIPLRETLRELIDAQLNEESDEQVTAYQKKLNELYDAFIGEFGYINNQGNSRAFSDDSSYYLLCSLERFNDEDEYIGKADIFTKRTVRKKEVITEAQNSLDALALSIGEKGRVDFVYMESLLKNKSREEIIDDLVGVVFCDPTDNRYVTADEYLSGNVRVKLQQAEEKAKDDPAFMVNVEALQQIQPERLDAADISVRLGATWIPDDVVSEFFWDLFDIPEERRENSGYSHPHVLYSPAADSWSVEGADWGISHVLNTSTYGTHRRKGTKIFEDVLNLRESKIIDYYEEDGKRKSVVNKEETVLAQEKQERIKEAFTDWVWQSPDRRERLVNIYNEKFNSFRPREYNGEYLLFHGMNPEITLRKHQCDAVARGIYGHNTLLDHSVGAGKTWAMAAIAMEGKRLGLSNKNMFVVPNHLIKQWASDFLMLYPAANILVATEKDFKPENRKKFCARIATGDFDAVIIGHSQFERIPVSDERQEQYMQQQIDDIADEIERIQEEGHNPLTVKQLERLKKSLEKNLDKFHDRVRKDDVITFEELGVDRLFIDEFHFYKNLWFYTKMQNIAGISTTGAQKTSDLFMKVGYLNEITGYKGLVGATGTPITNSMSEFYSLQRYFTPHVLKSLGLSSFDSWASTFGEVVTSVELAPEGTNYRTKQRFAKFYNIPELITLYHDFADVKTPEQLKLPVPEAEFINVVAKASSEQKDFLKELGKRADAVRDGKVDPTEDNMLKITTDGRKLALDARILDESLSDFEGSKVNLCVENLYHIWEDTKEDRLTQLVFCDLSTPAANKKKADALSLSEPDQPGFDNVYTDIKQKLVDKGIPAEEIAFIHDANTSKRKEKLFSDVRNGKVRILIGSTGKMGVGTNVQDRVIALHDLDCPWRPSDLEQRLGRGIRQGNKNEKVQVYRYITEGTFDAYSYQLVEQKQNFIGQVRHGSVNVRSADDIDSSALMYSEIKALSAGNPLIKEKMDLDVQVHKLNLLRTEFLRNRYRLEDAVAKKYPKTIAVCKMKLRDIQKDVDALQDFKEKPFSISLMGSVYTDPKEAAKALEPLIAKNKSIEKKKIGEYAGLDILVDYSQLSKSHCVTLAGHYQYFFEAYLSGNRNLKAIEEIVSKIPDKIPEIKEHLAETENDLKKAQEELKKDFAYEDELKEKNQRLTELNIILNVEGGAGKEEVLKPAKNPETPPELLSKLCSHNSEEVREAVAGNPSVNQKDLLVLKDDDVEAVRLAAYSNAKMPEDVLMEYCSQADENELSKFLEKRELNQKFIAVLLDRADGNNNLSYRIARHKSMTPEQLHSLAARASKYLFSTILERKDLLPETIELMAEKSSGDWYSSSAIARHPQCSEDRMIKYCLDSNYGYLFQSEILSNPEITNEVLKVIIENGNYSARIRAKELLEERMAVEPRCDNKDIITDDSYIPASETLNTSGHTSLDSRISEIQGRIFENADEAHSSYKSMETREY